MVKEAVTKIYKTGSRHFIYLPKDLVTDSNFPLNIGEHLHVKIEGKKLIIEEALKENLKTKPEKIEPCS